MEAGMKVISIAGDLDRGARHTNVLLSRIMLVEIILCVEKVLDLCDGRIEELCTQVVRWVSARFEA
jgi:hypothetical protein